MANKRIRKKRSRLFPQLGPRKRARAIADYNAMLNELRSALTKGCDSMPDWEGPFQVEDLDIHLVGPVATFKTSHLAFYKALRATKPELE